MTEQVYLAFYKGRKTGSTPTALLARFSDWLTRKLTRGEYSHCEMAIKKQVFTSGSHYDNEIFYECYSSSIRDGGVRCKVIDVTNEKWDLVPLTGVSESQIELYYQLTKGRPYDWWGAIGVVFGMRENSNKFFCSEWCANAINGGKEG
ncbi:enoyl-CoA hydratase [Chelonobacter oris]|uniref:enoyl-CoA hydratase n=1 Tax=Chelonobacter oris TaxID=505317 RepID=UPI00244D755B|nr:enoyl-CoA hydratase [Chelonobacter oris]MDH3001508.1 enoyl-CoA hydratase [Chelonobacter oris]